MKLKAGNTKLSKPGLTFMLAGCWVLIFKNEFVIKSNFLEKNILKNYNWLVFHLEVFYQIFPNSFLLFIWLFAGMKYPFWSSDDWKSSCEIFTMFPESRVLDVCDVQKFSYEN